MNVTTLLHELTPKHFRKYAYWVNVKAYSFFLGYLMLVAIGLIYLGSRINTTLAVVMAVGIFGLMPFSIADTATSEKTLKKRNGQAFDRKRIFEFTESGMSVKSESGSHSFVVWSDIQQASYKDEIIRIPLSAQIVHLIPDTAWPSPRERDQLLSLLREKGLLKEPK